MPSMRVNSNERPMTTAGMAARLSAAGTIAGAGLGGLLGLVGGPPGAAMGVMIGAGAGASLGGLFYAVARFGTSDPHP